MSKTPRCRQQMDLASDDKIENRALESVSIFNLVGRGDVELLKQVCILVHLQGESIDLDLVLAPHQGQIVMK